MKNEERELKVVFDGKKNLIREQIMKLIKFGIVPKTIEGNTPLLYAAINNDIEMLKAVLETDLDFNSIEYEDIIATLSEYTECKGEVYDLILDAGADMNCKSDWTIKMLINNDNISIIKKLIERGFDFTQHNNIAICLAADNGNTEIVQLLIEAGAEVNAFDGAPICSAASEGYFDLVRILVDNGADVTAENYSAIRSALDYNNISAVKYMVRKLKDK